MTKTELDYRNELNRFGPNVIELQRLLSYDLKVRHAQDVIKNFYGNVVKRQLGRKYEEVWLEALSIVNPGKVMEDGRQP